MKNILPEEQRDKFISFIKENNFDVQQCINTMYYNHYKRVIELYNMYSDALVFLRFDNFKIFITQIDYKVDGFNSLREWIDMFSNTYNNILKSRESEGYYLITRKEAESYINEYKAA